MKIINLFVLVCLVFFAQIYAGIAQTIAIDSSSQQYAFNNAVSILNTTLGSNSRLYNGPEYYFYDPLIKGNAYFLDVNSFTLGSVNYNGAVFSGVPMLYDLYKDEVVVLLYNHFSKFSLLGDKLSSFDFLGHHFVTVNADTVNSNRALKSGIYDQLYAGRTQILGKRSKDIQANTSTQTIESFFNNKKPDYFIREKGVFYGFSSQSSLLEILKDHKKQLQQFIKSGNLKYRKNPEEVMVKITAYYDQLK